MFHIKKIKKSLHVSYSYPKQEILINTLALQEAKDSSEIENIVTTHDELYKSSLEVGEAISAESKEVQNYIAALKKGFAIVKKTELLTVNSIFGNSGSTGTKQCWFKKTAGNKLEKSKNRRSCL